MDDNKKQGEITKAASRMGLATLFSRILGLAREQVFAFYFGASHAADAFNIAFRIPNLLRDLFAEGAMSAAFVPNFTKELVVSKRSAFELLGAVLLVLLTGLTLVSALGILLSPQLVGLYASSFKAIPGKFEMAVGLTQVMFPFFPLVAAAAVTMGALNALGFFFLPAFAPVLFNVASIFAGIVLIPIFKMTKTADPIFAMAIGVLLGGFLQFYLQWWQIKKQGFRYREMMPLLRNPGAALSRAKGVLLLLIPGTVGLAATQLNILVNSVYATKAGPGAVSWLNYAFRLMQFPIGIFGVSIAAATLPAVSRFLAQNSRAEAANQVKNSLKLTLAVNAPAAGGLIGAGFPIIALLFQHGRFGNADTTYTYQALFWYAVGLPGYSAVKVLVPIFYALGTTRIPVLISFVMVLLNAAVNHFCLDVLRYPFWALALATSAVATLNSLLLLYFLNRILRGVLDRKLALSVLLHTALGGVVAAVSAVTVRVSSSLFSGLVDTGSLGAAVGWTLEVCLAIFFGIGFWVVIGHLLGVQEIKRAISFFGNFIGKKLKWRKTQPTNTP